MTQTKQAHYHDQHQRFIDNHHNDLSKNITIIRILWILLTMKEL